jgi:two-component system sensor kinase FixL
VKVLLDPHHPRSTKGEARTRTAADRRALVADRVRVLLVEDDEQHAELVRRAFDAAPTLVLDVARGLGEAKALIEASAPDLVIADLNLPDGEGIELVYGAAYPVLIMTSQGSEGTAVAAMKAGALDYVVKSDATFSDMAHIVSRTLREWSGLQARLRADRLARAQFEIASTLATSLTLAEAGPKILATICKHVGWVLGELWRADRTGELLQRQAFWSADASLEQTAAAIPEGGITITLGVPGFTWQKGEALSIRDLSEIPGLDRRGLAIAGVRGAFGFAVKSSGRLLGVMTFFSRDIQPPDDGLRRLLEATSSQIAIFLAREEAEEDRTVLNAALVERERLAAIGQTAAMLGHEIANPLNCMFLAGQLMQMRVASLPDPDPKIAENLARMMAANRRLNGLLEDFRSLSMRQIIQRVPTDLRAIVDRVIGLQRHAFDEAGVSVAIEVSASLPLVAIDGAKLTQVLLNLTKNAAEAMTTSGGVLSVRARLSGASLIVEVQDTGPGIPDHVDVFEPFRTTKAKGTGLGVPIARQILAAHDGMFEYESVVGSGTTFRIVMPTSSSS